MRTVWSSVPMIALGAIFASAGARPAAAQGGFEGVITYEVHQNKGPATIVATTKGNKLRMDMQASQPGGGGGIIINADAHTKTIIIAQQKKYMVLPDNMGNPMGGVAQPDKGATPAYTITKTGRTETVAGVSCDVIHGTTVRDGKTEEGEICVAKGMGLNAQIWGSLASGAGAAQNPQLAAIRDAVGPGNGILKVTSIKNGQPEVVIVVTKIERKSVSDDAFSPPSDYTQMQMPQMRGGAGAGAPPQ
jgi:hypothetical protein